MTASNASSFRNAGILFALWLMVFTAASQTIIITPILPLIGEALETSEERLGLLVSLYSWALALAALVMGPISDRIGRRRVLLIGSGSLAGALALHGLADSFGSLLAARLLAGACGGMLSGAAVAYVGDYYPYERRGWATGLVMSGVAFGLVLGVPMGRVLAAGLGFRVPFLAFAGIMAASFLLILTVIPQPDVELDDAPLRVSRALRHYGDLLTTPATLAAALTYFLMYLGLGLLVVYLPQWITDRFTLEVTLFGKPLTLFGLPIDFIATLYSVGGLASVLIGPLAGSLSDRTGRKPLILISCVGLMVLTALLTYIITERWLAYVAYLGVMVFFSLRMSPLQALLTALTPGRQRGSLMSLTIALGQVGTGVGAALSGVLFGLYGYRASTFASTAAVLMLALVVWRFLPEPSEDPDAPETPPEHPVSA